MKKNSKLIVIFILIYLPFNSIAQQAPYYNNIRENWGLLNPAFLDFRYYDYMKKQGYRPDLFLSGGIRHQYLNKGIGISNANIRIECYECLTERVKLSTGLIVDKIGTFQEAGIFGQFGWQVIKNKLMVAYGLKINSQWIKVNQNDFVNFDSDPTAQEAVLSRPYINVHSDLGLSYITTITNSNKLYFGVGLTQVLSNQQHQNLRLVKVPQWNAFLGALIRKKTSETSRTIQWEPIVLIKYIDGVSSFWFQSNNQRMPITIDGSIRLSSIKDGEKANDFRLGLGGSSNGTFQAEVGFVFHKKDALIISPTILTLSRFRGMGLEIAYTHSWGNLFGNKNN